MAEIKPRLVLDVSATLILDERECAALDALAGYGDEAFLKVFYAHLGRSYLSPYEVGLRSLFKKVRQVAPPALRTIRDARRVLADARKAERGAP
jgi:hypothetical protein